MSRLRELTLISLLLLVVAVGCSSSDQAAIDKAVSATLAGAQPATAVAPATSTPARVTEPTAAPVPTPEPVESTLPPVVPTLNALNQRLKQASLPHHLQETPTPVPTRARQFGTETNIVTVTAKTRLIGTQSSPIALERVYVKTLSDVGILEAWVKWSEGEEWEQVNIDQETLVILGSHIYSTAGEHVTIVKVQGETGDEGSVYILVDVIPTAPTPTATPTLIPIATPRPVVQVNGVFNGTTTWRDVSIELSGSVLVPALLESIMDLLCGRRFADRQKMFEAREPRKNIDPLQPGISC
ncbi:MAG: hypothetical protein O3C20_18985 [Verrucomicrobia bacterium]|nr:hypothetical protein [Verrucomicrobiota bacterium]